MSAFHSGKWRTHSDLLAFRNKRRRLREIQCEDRERGPAKVATARWIAPARFDRSLSLSRIARDGRLDCSIGLIAVSSGAHAARAQQLRVCAKEPKPG